VGRGARQRHPGHADHRRQWCSRGPLVEISASGPTKLLGAVGGAGDQSPVSIGAIGPDAVGITIATTGELSFGTTTVQTVANDHALAVLAI
jgi:hypothetical protein